MKGDYENGRIYKIEPICDHKENEVYYGSTSQKLCKRMDAHRGNYNQWKKNGKARKVRVYDLFDKYGIENCRIYLIENYPCDSKEQLESREGYYIKNNVCVNKYVAGRTPKQYYNDNKEKTKKYYNDNKEKLVEKQKKYYKDNKEKMYNKSKIKYICGCGSCFRSAGKAQHEKSKTHKKYQQRMVDELAALKELNKMHNEIIKKHKQFYF